MKTAVLLGLMLCVIHAAYAATHSYQYIYTATSGIPEFPEFVAAGMVDAGQISYYDSKAKETVCSQEWVKGAVDPQFWQRSTQIFSATHPQFKVAIDTLKKRFNQTGGVHVYQTMYGCEWDDETGTTDGFYQFGYDGADLVVFDMKNMRWIAPLSQGAVTKNKWDSDSAYNAGQKNYLTQICIEWLKKYVNYWRSTLERRDHPEVSVFQKDSSSPVICHATGFFPHGIMVTWQRDGEEVQEDVELGRRCQRGWNFPDSISRHSEAWDTHTYTCTVQHKSLEEDIIRTHSPDSSGPHGHHHRLCGGGSLVALAVIGVIMWKKRVQAMGRRTPLTLIQRTLTNVWRKPETSLSDAQGGAAGGRSHTLFVTV
ncbi:hypothetical protein AGOR_G00043990 [Albula goreensis]|uniref:Ig-like domain-containing protein n=1 Tax=Albula goreensis TaxID=1534307 RepID=A0A8T3DZJ0_9TELE|nr:hypothetical protein AGOR_G00043990 [Albula goreensis]